MKTTKCSLKLSAFTFLLAAILLTGCQSLGGNFNASSTQNPTLGNGEVSLVTMTDTIESNGNVQALQSATLSWKTTGTVGEVKVKAGDKVKKGDILMNIDPSTAPANMVSAQAELVTARQNLENLKPDDLAKANAYKTLVDAQQTLEDAKDTRKNLDYRASPETLDSARLTLLQAQESVERAQKAFDDVQNKDKDDVVYVRAQSNLSTAIATRERAQWALDWLTTPPTAKEIAEAEANITVAEASLKDAEAKWKSISEGTGIDANDLLVATAKVQAAETTVNSLSIIAPFDGDILVVNNMPGDLVSGSTDAIIIVNRTQLLVDVPVDEGDISRVTAGQSVSITMDVLPGETLTGKVSWINPIGVSNSGVVQYKVRIIFDQANPRILMGATAYVTIQISQPEEKLAVPVSAVQSDDQGEFVMRLNSDGAFMRIDVVSGLIIDDRVLVTGELANGDAVQLIATTTSSATDNAFGGGMIMGGGERVRPDSGNNDQP